jgi:hypothetical protein
MRFYIVFDGCKTSTALLGQVDHIATVVITTSIIVDNKDLDANANVRLRLKRARGNGRNTNLMRLASSLKFHQATVACSEAICLTT